MNVIDAISQRRSIRAYEDRPVEEEKLQAVLEAGRLAPSANNMQEWRYVIIREQKIRNELMAAAKGQRFVSEAPVVIACCAETDEKIMTCGQLAYTIDVAISIDHMTLAAVEQGLGTCWIGAFYEDQVKQILKIPATIRVVQLLTLGYPKGLPAPRSRLPIEKIVMYEKWGK